MALGTYNRTPANRISSASMQYRARYSMFGNTQLNMQVSARIFAQYRMNAELSAAMDLWWGFDEKYAMAASLNADMKAYALVSQPYAMEGELSMKANPKLFEVYRMRGDLDAPMAIREVVSPKYGTLTGSLIMHVNSVQEKLTEMSFADMVIPSGSVLVIDTENYVITLDGENMIDLYDGGWFRFLPELLGMEVTSGTSGKPSVSVLYREAYL